VRLADWPRNPYLNEELREWVELHLRAIGVQDIAVYAVASPRHDDERRVLVATDAGLLDGWYAPRGSTARFSLSVRLVPWQAVHGVDLRGETFRLWAHEHQSRWRLRIAQPAFDTLADDPQLGSALAEFATVCAVMAEPAGSRADDGDDDLPPPIPRARADGSARPAIHVEPMPEPPDASDASGNGSSTSFERRIGLRSEG
jgi:hypothetical protein